MLDSKRPDSRNALRRLVIIAAIVIGFIIYAYGFKVTDISLEETLDPVRQDSLQRAMRELLSPDIFDQETTEQLISTQFQKECVAGATVEQPAQEAGQPYIQLTPNCGVRNDIVTVEGFNFVANSSGRIFLIRPTGDRQPFDLVNDPGNSAFTIDGLGHFIAQIKMPNLRGDAGTLHEIQVDADVPAGLPYFSATTNIVIEKMIETVFLALMATTIALPIAAVISFLAAHNLMRDIRIPLGNILIGFALLPVGWGIGSWLLGMIGKFGFDLGKGLLMGLVAPALAAGAFIFVSRAVSKTELKANSLENRLRGILMTVLLLVVIVFALGALGGIGIWLGTQLKEGIPGNIGYMMGVLGLLVELTIVPLAGLIGAFYISSLGMEFTAPPLKYVHGIQSHLTAGFLGGVDGALLMAGVATIGSSAALLTVIPPVILGILGGAVLARLYEWRFEPIRRVNRSVPSRLVLFFGSVVIFILTAHILDVMHFIVIARLPSPDFITRSAIMGAILGAMGSGLVGMHSAFPIGDTVYTVTRTILNALRSIEPLIMGIIFVIWVSIGPFAGVLALTLHSIASLGKLYSEQIESIDLGPLEAIQSTGATRLQTIIYAVVPQIVPPYISFTMYRWDINVRMSTIIGFVGGGGIGFLLQQQINLLRYDQAGVAVLAIAIVVSILDYASASLRERVV